MPAGAFGAGLSGGLAHGLMQGYQLQQYRDQLEQHKEELGLRKKLVESQAGLYDIETQKHAMAVQSALKQALMNESLGAQFEQMGQGQPSQAQSPFGAQFNVPNPGAPPANTPSIDLSPNEAPDAIGVPQGQASSVDQTRPNLSGMEGAYSPAVAPMPNANIRAMLARGGDLKGAIAGLPGFEPPTPHAIGPHGLYVPGKGVITGTPDAPGHDPATLAAAELFPGQTLQQVMSNPVNMKALNARILQDKNEYRGETPTQNAIASSLGYASFSAAPQEAKKKILDIEARRMPTARIEVTNAANNREVISPHLADVHGDAYLQTLPTGKANEVRAIVNYALDPKALASMRTGAREELMQQAIQVDPTFSMAKYPIRMQVMKDFTSGPESNKIESLDQSLNHMGALLEASKNLPNGSVLAKNKLVNFFQTQMGHPEINTYELATQAVGEELMRVFRQVNASESEAKAFEQKFGSYMSKGQISDAVGMASKLLTGRVQAIDAKWNRGMESKTGFVMGHLSPGAQAVASSLGMGGGTPTPQPNQGDAAIVRDDASYNALPSGTMFIGPDGQKRRKP